MVAKGGDDAIAAERLENVRSRRDPDHSQVNLPRVEGASEEFLEPRRNQPQISKILRSPSYFGYKLELVLIVRHQSKTNI